MADRTSAGVFGMVFKFLAERPTSRARILAKKLWNETSAFDFAPYQMDADKALVKLYLADKCRKCKAIDYLDGEEHECEGAP